MSEAATILDPAAAAPAATAPVAAPVSPTPAPATGDPAPVDPAASTAEAGQPDWRKMLAGEDEKALKQLERYDAPDAFMKSFVEAQNLIRSKTEGMVKLPGEGATDDEKQAFAKALGIPEAPDKYERIAPPEGLDLSDADKKFLDGAVSELHKMGGFAAHPEVVKTLEGFYHKAMQEQAAQIAANAEMKAAEGRRQLQQVYGNNFELEMKHANAALTAFGPRDPEKLNGFLNQQMLDGTKLGDNPEIIQMLVRASRATQEDPMFLNTLSDGLPSNPADVQSKINDIMKTRGTPEYAQREQELKQLLAQRERLSGRG